MTREEAIEVIEQDIPCEYDKDLIEALDMAIKALKQEKFETVTEFADRCRECGAKYGKLLKQEPCENAISRRAVEKITWEEPSYSDALNVLTEVRDKVRALPPVNAQSKTGHWISTRNAENVGVLRCSICGFINEWGIDRRGKGTYNFCPNCGAKMVEPQESEEI